jgi:cell division transport system permease protein
MRRWLRHHGQSFVQTARKLAGAPVSSALNILVIAIALSLPLMGYVLLANLQGVLHGLPVDEQISVFLDPAAARRDAQELEHLLRSQAGVSEVRFVSKEAALGRLKRTAQLEDIVALLRTNPLPDALIVTLAGATPGVSERVAAAARSHRMVNHVQADADWARRLKALLNLGRTGLVLLSGLLGVALVAVIFNTIRLQILTQRAEIEVSRLVGATDDYIRRPFFYLGMLQGLLGGLVALGLVTASLAFLDGDVATLSGLYGTGFRLSGLAGSDSAAFLLFGVLLGWLGAHLSVSMHLHQSDSR